MPLKTYLPDGDIDLTAFSENENLRDNWAQEVRDKLEIEEKSENAEFQVKEVQFIRAEVSTISFSAYKFWTCLFTSVYPLLLFRLLKANKLCLRAMHLNDIVNLHVVSVTVHNIDTDACVSLNKLVSTEAGYSSLQQLAKWIFND